MNIAKMMFPLLTLPYLTRVLTADCFGVVAYVKAVMQYMQLIVDFGFVLSGTKDMYCVKPPFLYPVKKAMNYTELRKQVIVY